jgi:hypothetical protein
MIETGTVELDISISFVHTRQPVRMDTKSIYSLAHRVHKFSKVYKQPQSFR